MGTGKGGWKVTRSNGRIKVGGKWKEGRQEESKGSVRKGRRRKKNNNISLQNKLLIPEGLTRLGAWALLREERKGKQNRGTLEKG